MSKILILGGGLIGPAAAFKAMADTQVAEVIISDFSRDQIERCLNHLKDKPGSDKLKGLELDIKNQPDAVAAMTGCDVIISALPQAISEFALRAALQANVPIVDIARP